MKIEGSVLYLALSLWGITAVGTFAVGLSIGQREMAIGSSVELENAQAKLLFNRIEDEQKIARLINNGCIEDAKAFTNYLADVDMQLMHRFVVRSDIGDAKSYIKNRNPEILREALGYLPRFPNPWKETVCN